jgi:hypothetical protein
VPDRYIFTNNRHPGIKYYLNCDAPTTQREANEKMAHWFETDGRFLPAYVPPQIELRLTSDGKVIRIQDSD